MGWIHKKIAGFQRDEAYIGTAEERAARNMGDNEDNLQIGPGHIVILPGFYEQAPKSLKRLLDSDPNVVAYLNALHRMEKGQVIENGHAIPDEITERDEDEVINL
jgi:phage major head subunit gpT-like protein